MIRILFNMATEFIKNFLRLNKKDYREYKS